MIKKTLILSIIAITILYPYSSINASRNAIIQGKEYVIDTLRHIKVGPGTMHTALLYTAVDKSKTFRAFFLSMDMKGHDNVEYKMEIGNDSTLTVETISNIAKRKTSTNKHYFAGVNADFYLTWIPYIGTPNMACYMDGEIAGTDRDEGNKMGHFFMDANKNMWCDYPIQSLSIITSQNKTIELARINYDLFDNEIVLFNSKYGKYTKTKDCTEIAVKLVEGEKWSINKKCKVQVVGSPVTKGNMKIAPGEAVLSAKGSSVPYITEMKDGDILTVDFKTRFGAYDISPEIKECSGGDIVILKRGEVEFNASRWINGRDNNNPRTMFGYNKERSIMVWGLIDGRSPISSGSTYPEGADVMALAGCYDAVNVDGGGSAGMYIQNIGIVNKPSDGKERAVSNGFFAVLNAPEDNEISEIKFIDYAMQFPKHGIYKPIFYGYNKYGMLINTDVQDVELTCQASLGTIKDKNIFIGNGVGTGALTATYNGITTSIPVTIINSQDVSLRLQSVINDTYRNYPVEVEATMNEIKMPINPAALSWNSDDVSIVSIGSEDGVLRGIENGTTKVRGSVGSFNGELEVIVEKPTARSMPIDANMDITTWKVSQVGGKNIKATLLENGIKLVYTGASGRAPNIKLAKKIKLWSLPDTIRLRINPGSAPINKITISTNAHKGSVVNSILIAPTANVMNTIDLPTADWCNAEDMLSFPLYINYISFDMGTSSTGTEYTIEIPGIEAVYKNVDLSGVDDVLKNENKIAVYPNPVTRGDIFTVITTEDDEINFYNHVGMLVKRVKTNGICNIDTSDMEMGVYIITASNGVKTFKLIIK